MDKNNLIVSQFLESLVGLALRIMGTGKIEPLVIRSGDKFHHRLTSTLIVQRTSEWTDPLVGRLVVTFF